MIGNDVVDRRDPETQPGATHPRFDRRVFAASERAALLASPEPNHLRWRLWAAKEAAYKVARKLDPGAVWAPSRFVVSLDEGVVRLGAETFALRIEEDGSYIHAVAWSAPLRGAWWGKAPPGRGSASPCGAERRAPQGLNESLALAGDGVGMVHHSVPARAVREIALRAIATALGVDTCDLAIHRRGRIPCVALRGEPAGVDLSLSHHGRFVAYAFARVAGT